MKAAKVYKAVGTQEEVGDQSCNGVQLRCNDTDERVFKFRADKTFYMGITTLVRGENVLAMLITPTNENEGHSYDVA